MTQQPAYQPRPGMPQPGWGRPEPGGMAGQWGAGPGRSPSGLFPAGFSRAPVRPTYREPHPVRGAAIAAGAGGALVWLLAFGLMGSGLSGYAWWTIFGVGTAWLVSVALTRVGDRGVAAGIAIVTSVGLSIAAVLVAVEWVIRSDWPLW